MLFLSCSYIFQSFQTSHYLLGRLTHTHVLERAVANWRVVPLVQTTQTHRPPSSSQKIPGTREAHRLPYLPSFISSRIHLGRDLTQCRYPSPGPPNRVSSKPGTRGTSQRLYSQETIAGHPTAPEKHLLICPPHTP